MIKPDIIDIITSEGVELRQHGRIYTGKCCFHNERTPSLTIWPEKQRFQCFGCGKSGDVISFIQDLKDFTFSEALAYLKIHGDSPGQCKDSETKRDLMARFRKWEKETFIDLAESEREWGCKLSKLDTIGKLYVSKDRLLEWQIMNYKLDILQNGSDKAKFDMWRNI